ncbi:MAG: hypothetical protein JXR34_12645 [Bacteroidales bacterium]|nr:hypothetical protein [Bacteroidales bacterium]
MLLALKKIEEINTNLSNEVKENKIIAFRMALKLDMRIHVTILTHQKAYMPEWLKHPSINVELVTEEDCFADGYYEQLFDRGVNPIDLGFKRRFSSFEKTNFDLKKRYQTPVVTFYSYKGGVGRTTALMAYALYAAKHKGQKVIVLDCDFEAPGYLNFFDLADNDKLLSGRANGIIEYFLDTEFENKELDLVENYTVLVDEKYSGNGEIRVMPAGNLNDDRFITEFPENTLDVATHKDHYIEGLARLDTAQPKSIVERFNKLLGTIEEQVKPDLILIDSRTGFSDILGVTALNLSSCIVGFFGSTEQTKPGLKFLLDQYYKIQQSNASKQEANLVLVNSILPERNTQEHVRLFRNEIDSHMTTKESDMAIDLFYLARNPVFENLGLKGNQSKFSNYIEKIEEHQKNDGYLELFNGISYKMVRHSIGDQNYEKDFAISKQDILKNLADLLEKDDGKVRLFAENETITPDLFFYRECMNEIIGKPEKFVVSGFKGTGKTYLYKALKNKNIKDELIRRAGIFYKKSFDETRKFEFLDVIEITNEIATEYKKKFPFKEIQLGKIQEPNFYFGRLWVIYTWNSIMISSSQYGYESKIPQMVLPINLFSETVSRYEKIIYDNSIYQLIEDDLRRFNSHLAANNITLILLYDQLDKDIHPENWRKCVSPLVKYWETNPFSSILPKIFVRTDLFRRLELNNSLNIKKSKTVSIEWTREELYSYFLKLLIAKSGKELKFLFEKSNFFNSEAEKELERAIEYDFQIGLERRLLEPLISLVFGDIVSTPRGSKLGTSYEYFHFNYKNADDNISIRPFINLISYACEEALKENEKHCNNLPIIHSDFYLNPNFRHKAVEEHFSDLTNEGNFELEYIISYLRETAEYRRQYLTETELSALLNGAIETYGDLKGKTNKELQELLEANGIIVEKIKPDGKIYYFAMLYKFWLGLKSRNYQYGRNRRLLNTKGLYLKIEQYINGAPYGFEIGDVYSYQTSLIGTKIFQATGNNWKDMFDYPDFAAFLSALERQGVIQLLEPNKFRLVKPINQEILRQL